MRGQVKDTNLDTYTPLRMGDAPELDIEFIDSTEVPVGLGEPATTVVAPAIGNAIFAASGARFVIYRSARRPCCRHSTPEPDPVTSDNGNVKHAGA